MKKTRTLTLAALFLALGVLLPYVVMQIPGLGSKLLPMHIPVLLCGFVCGGAAGGLVGLIVPLFSSVLFGMPPLFPVALSMAFELAAYGLLAGLFYRAFPKNIFFTLLSLVLAMVGGRIVWGVASYILYGLAGSAFTWEVFLAGAILNAVVGIVVQLVLIPLLVAAFKRGNLMV